MIATDILDLPGWAVRSTEEKGDHLIIEASVVEMPRACPLCGSVKPPYHFGYRPILLADLPIRMKPVSVVARRRRYRCRDCSGTFLDQLPGIYTRHEATERLISYIEVQALHLTQTFTRLASTLGVSEWLIRDVFAAHVETLEHDYVIQTPRYLGIDEIYIEHPGNPPTVPAHRLLEQMGIQFIPLPLGLLLALARSWVCDAIAAVTLIA